MEKTEEDSPLKEVWLQRETGSSWGAVRKGCWLKSLVSSWEREESPRVSTMMSQ